MPPATQVARRSGYRPGFLSAIDACLKVRHSERPRSVAQLRPMMLGRKSQPRPGLDRFVEVFKTPSKAPQKATSQTAEPSPRNPSPGRSRASGPAQPASRRWPADCRGHRGHAGRRLRRLRVHALAAAPSRSRPSAERRGDCGQEEGRRGEARRLQEERIAADKRASEERARQEAEARRLADAAAAKKKADDEAKARAEAEARRRQEERLAAEERARQEAEAKRLADAAAAEKRRPRSALARKPRPRSWPMRLQPRRRSTRSVPARRRRPRSSLTRPQPRRRPTTSAPARRPKPRGWPMRLRQEES